MAATILVAEDDVITRWDLREILEAHGYQVLEARDGEEALLLARERQPDLLLLDIKMPGVGGLEVAERLSGSDIPIVFLTAYSQRPLVERAKSLAVQGFLVKPAPEGEVVAAVELALANAAQLRQLTRDLRRTSERLAHRKEVERAKDLLAQEAGVGADEAYRRLRRRSMELHVPLHELARRVLQGDWEGLL